MLWRRKNNLKLYVIVVKYWGHIAQTEIEFFLSEIKVLFEIFFQIPVCLFFCDFMLISFIPLQA